MFAKLRVRKQRSGLHSDWRSKEGLPAALEPVHSNTPLIASCCVEGYNCGLPGKSSAGPQGRTRVTSSHRRISRNRKSRPCQGQSVFRISVGVVMPPRRTRRLASPQSSPNVPKGSTEARPSTTAGIEATGKSVTSAKPAFFQCDRNITCSLSPDCPQISFAPSVVRER